MKIEVCILFILVIKNYMNVRLVSKPNSITLVNKNKGHVSKDVSMLFDDRYLLDTLVSKFKQKFKLKSKTSMSKKLKLMKLAHSIRQSSKKRKMKIKKVQVGSNISKLFKGKRALKLLTSYLNDKNFDIKYKMAKQKYNKTKKKRWLKKLKNQEQLKLKKEMIAKLQSGNYIKSNYQPKNIKEEQNYENRDIENSRNLNQKFDYLPNFGGIPYPPVAVGGVNYHAPMNVVVNTLPYPNPRAYESPYDRAKRNVDNQSNIIS